MADEEDLRRLLGGERDLTKSDFRAADLTGADLTGRDFSGALFDRTNLSNADLRGSVLTDATLNLTKLEGANLAGVRFPQRIIHVKLGRANLRSAIFNSCHFATVDLTGADIRGAKFRSVIFMDDVKFEDVTFDSETDFEGATGLRYLSRLPAFANYNYEKGKFTRKTEAAAASTEGADTFKATIEVRDPPRNVPTVRIAASLPEVRGLAASLALAIEGQIQAIEAAKPNELDALARHQSQVEFLQQISGGLQEISVALTDLDSDVAQNSAGVTRAARIAADLSEKLETWVAKNGESLVGSTINVGMIAAASTLFWMCGAHAPFGFAVATAVVGGKPVVDNVKELISAWKKGPH